MPDTGKVNKGFDIVAVLKWAKSNPWILAAVAGGGGIGGEQISTLFGQEIPAWQIVVGIASFALIDLFGRVLKRLDAIEVRLGEGTALMKEHDKALVELLAWREHITEAPGPVASMIDKDPSV